MSKWGWNVWKNRDKRHRVVDWDLDWADDVIDLTSSDLDDDVDILDHRVLLGSLKGNIVGLQYYAGTVSKNEMVSLVREPRNKYDPNAIKVENVFGEQVGHIKRQMAKPLAQIVDTGIAQMEGIVPFGQSNKYSMPVNISLWGAAEKRQQAATILRRHGFQLQEDGGQYAKGGGGESNWAATAAAAPSYMPTATLGRGSKYITKAEMKDKLDDLFEDLKEQDKTKMMEPAQAVVTKLYPHQKQALAWMVSKENSDQLPPFWEKKKNGMYFNTVTNFACAAKPQPLKGGILADDMGLGKTLEVIALIMTNFYDGKPLAVPVEGFHKIQQIRKTKQARGRGNQKKSQGKKKSARRVKEKFVVDTDSEEEDGWVSEEEKEAEEAVNSDNITDSEKEEEEEAEVKILSENLDLKVAPAVSQPEEAAAVLIVSPNVKRRPKRATKKPARYIFSESDEEGTDAPSPKKKVKIDPPKKRGQPPTKQPAAAAAADTALAAGQISGQGAVTMATVMEKAPAKRGRKPKHQLPRGAKGAPQQPEPVQGMVAQGGGQAKGRQPAAAAAKEPGGAAGGKDRVGPSSSKDNTVTFSLAQDQTAPVEGGRAPAKGPRPTLIICPLSVVSNWLDQFEEHVSSQVDLRLYTHCGSNRTKLASELTDQDVVITTYSTLAANFKAHKEKGPIHQTRWLRVVLDEGHIIRNVKTLQSKAVFALKAERKWALTGTPIQNALRDLFAIISFLRLKPLDDRHLWHRTLERPVNNGDTTALKRVQRLMGSMALRRTKTQRVDGKLLVDLPPRSVVVQTLTLTPDERVVYDAVSREGRVTIGKYFKQGTMLVNYGNVLAILLRLRQLCCHPGLCTSAITSLVSDGDGTNEELRQKLVASLMAVLSQGSDEECCVCLESLTSPVITHCAHVFCRPCIQEVIRTDNMNAKCPLCRGDIKIDELIEVPEVAEGSADPAEEWHSSTKVDAVMESLINLRKEDPSIKSIVISQFTKLLDLVEKPLSDSGFHFVRLDGSMSQWRRAEAIEEFQSQEAGSPAVFLLSLKAGGVGINLTAASRVFLLDPAWNPAVEEQCFDRCHRLGQTREVVITKFVVEDSVEEKMLDFQKKKMELMKGAFGKKPSAKEKQEVRMREIRALMDLPSGGQ